MSEKTPQNEAASPKRGKLKLILIIAALMGVEGVGVFFIVKAVSGPPAVAEAEGHGDEVDGASEVAAGSHHAENADGHGGDGKSEGKGDKPGKLSLAQSEIELPECRPSNRMTGKLVLFRMRVSVLVNTPQLERAKALIDANKSRIHDRINYVVRSADPMHLNEPGLDTIKRRIKQELDQITGDAELIQEVLIPELLQSGYGL